MEFILEIRMLSGNPIITSVVSNIQPRSFFVQGEETTRTQGVETTRTQGVETTRTQGVETTRTQGVERSLKHLPYRYIKGNCLKYFYIWWWKA